jgi:hypothetical protein
MSGTGASHLTPMEAPRLPFFLETLRNQRRHLATIYFWSRG